MGTPLAGLHSAVTSSDEQLKALGLPRASAAIGRAQTRGDPVDDFAVDSRPTIGVSPNLCSFRYAVAGNSHQCHTLPKLTED